MTHKIFLVVLILQIFRVNAMLKQTCNTSHVVVVGGGLAGLTAAIEAARGGAAVTLLEKEKNVGGNSAKASSGINSAVSKYQVQLQIHDSVEDFQKDTLKSGGGTSIPSLVEVLTNSSKEALEWIESFGLKLDYISHCGGHSASRTHRESPRADGKPAPVGWDIIKTLKEYISKELTNSVAFPESTIASANTTNLPEPFTIRILTG
ncbi:NADH-cytochrome b5 reductase, partial [Nowakowskiella sp. JEL0078]